MAEFNYRPGPCRQDYLVVVLRKQLVIEKEGQQVGAGARYFFPITNEWTWERPAVVYFANDRCNRENLIEQTKNGVRALHAPVDTLAALEGWTASWRKSSRSSKLMDQTALLRGVSSRKRRR